MPVEVLREREGPLDLRSEKHQTRADTRTSKHYARLSLLLFFLSVRIDGRCASGSTYASAGSLSIVPVGWLAATSPMPDTGVLSQEAK